MKSLSHLVPNTATDSNFAIDEKLKEEFKKISSFKKARARSAT